MSIIDISNTDRILGIFLSPWRPVLVGVRNIRRVKDAIISKMSHCTYDRVHLEWGQMALYGDLISPIPRKTIFCHDILSDWAQARCNREKFGFLRLFWEIELRKCEAWERGAYQVFDRIFVPSEKDKDLLIRINPGYSNRISVSRLEFSSYKEVINCRRTSDSVKPHIVFWGSYARHENVDGAMWLVREVLPRVREMIPEATVTILGADPPPSLQKMQSECIRVTGRVDDPAPFFAEASLAVLPLFVGAGVKVKVLECMSAGLPVITTPVGSEGLPWGRDNGLIVLDADPMLFANEVISLFSDTRLLKHLQHRASETIIRYERENHAVL